MSGDVRDFEVRGREAEASGGAERWTFAVHVPTRLCYFQGHFEGYPVLPGVAQLNNLVLRLVRETWTSMPGLRRATQLKFHRVIAPGSDLTVRLERLAGVPEVVFSIEHGGVVASAGTLLFGEART